MELFDKLNDKQSEAVKATEGYIRVIAGAGSGKTKLLVSRYAYLVQEYGIDSANILCVTFTNKAAGEMKKRIRALIGQQYDTSLICTYHGFCSRLLRENPEKLFFTKSFQILDPSQQKSILEGIFQKYELKLDYASFESILKKIGLIKSNTDYVPRFCDPKPCQILSNVENQDDKIIEEFLQQQKAIYSLDFNDLMNFALYLLETDQEIREKWQDRLNYIQVDEFQDSSKRELTLVDILSGKYNNLMIVGDPDQNIYEWRGSDVNLLVDFDKTHSPTETIFLNQNYRSTPQILRCANHLIEKNELRLKKDLFTEAKDGSEVYHIHSKNDEEENNTLIDNIRRIKREKEYTFSDFAVLYRSGFLSRIIEKKFVESNIPYEIYSGVKFYQRMEILDIIAYLRLIAFDDDTSFKRIINTPRRKFGRTKMSYLENLKENTFSLFDSEGSSSLFNTLKNNLSDSIFKSSGAYNFVNFVESMRQYALSAKISEIVDRVTVESGYEQYIRELGDEERLDNLSEFKRISHEFENSFGESLTLQEFLNQIALQSGESEEKPQDAVKLMTIHSAKGLEFPVVFIVGFTEGIFPSSKTIEERKKLGLEEERRLCYVAITRAKEHLFFMDSEGVSEKGIKKLPSRFLDEIGIENYVRLGKISDELMQETYTYIKKNSYLYPAPTKSSLSIGKGVEHHGFGSGIIVGIDERRGSYIVKFDKLAQTRNISKDYFERLYNPIQKELYNTCKEEHSDIATTAERTLSSSVSDPFIGLLHNREQGIIQSPTDTETQNETPKNTFSKMEQFFKTQLGDIKQDSEETAIDNNVNLNVSVAPSEDNTTVSNNKSIAGIKTHTISNELRQEISDAPNLWNMDDVPHNGWSCVGVTDLGEACGICEMCGNQIIRYVHHMIHPRYHPLNAGCICAGKMEDDIAAAKKREQDFKNKQSRRENFHNRKWKQSRNGNSYIKIKDHIVLLYKTKNWIGWKYSIDNVFCDKVFKSREEAVDAAFEALDKLINN